MGIFFPAFFLYLRNSYYFDMESNRTFSLKALNPLQKTDEGAPISGDPPTGKSLALSYNGLMKFRTMWSTVNPLRLQAPLDFRPEIQRLFVF